jgi:hypothetical protein
MKVRAYEERDLEKVMELAAKTAKDWELPDLKNPLLLTKLVLVDENDSPVMGGFLRVTSEAYIVKDFDWSSPAFRWVGFQMLHQALIEDGVKKGFQDSHAWVSPGIERSFGRRLMSLGWEKPKSASFTLKVR